MTCLLLVGLAPFIVMGVILGHLVTIDALAAAVGGLVVVASQDTVAQLTAVIRKIARVVPHAADVVAPVCRLDYSRPGKPVTDWDDGQACPALYATSSFVKFSKRVGAGSEGVIGGGGLLSQRIEDDVH